ncbi:hypothetical protein Elgi_37880 [Paenibacillus elgii]|uniref:hypothetical protein n=1 Tax=Paenibacillus elgii TaxID=189691 RepID=UPI002D7D2B5F|nr:hypothetical protein Elgi_37880 [Paenibacillus elgii]
MYRLDTLIFILITTAMLSACVSKDTAQPASSQSSISEQKSATVQSQEQQPKVDNSKKEKDFKDALKKYVDENFGMSGLKTSWYDLIKDYKVTISEKETVVSVIVSSTTDTSKATNITSTVLGFVNDNTQKEFKAHKVIIITEDNKTLSDKTNPIK